MTDAVITIPVVTDTPIATPTPSPITPTPSPITPTSAPVAPTTTPVATVPAPQPTTAPPSTPSSSAPQPVTDVPSTTSTPAPPADTTPSPQKPTTQKPGTSEAPTPSTSSTQTTKRPETPTTTPPQVSLGPQPTNSSNLPSTTAIDKPGTGTPSPNLDNLSPKTTPIFDPPTWPLDLTSKQTSLIPATTIPEELNNPNSEPEYIAVGSILFALVCCVVLVVLIIRRRSKSRDSQDDDDDIVMLQNVSYIQDKRADSSALYMTSSFEWKTRIVAPDNPSTTTSNSRTIDLNELSIHDTPRSNLSLLAGDNETPTVVNRYTTSLEAFEDAVRDSYDTKSPSGSQISYGWETALESEQSRGSYKTESTDYGSRQSFGSSIEVPSTSNL